MALSSDELAARMLRALREDDPPMKRESDFFLDMKSQANEAQEVIF